MFEYPGREVSAPPVIEHDIFKLPPSGGVIIVAKDYPAQRRLARPALFLAAALPRAAFATVRGAL